MQGDSYLCVLTKSARMKHILPVILLLWTLCAAAVAPERVAPNPYGDRPVIVPLPTSVPGLAQPVRRLEGAWDVLPGSPEGVHRLQRRVSVPAEFSGYRIFLRLSHTTQHAILSVNGHPVRDNWGVSGAWTADITDSVQPGAEALLDLTIERTGGLGRFVRFFPAVGDTELFAVPADHITRLHMTHEFDADYRDADVVVRLQRSTAAPGSLRLSFTDAQGRRLQVSPATVRLPAGEGEVSYRVRVKSPQKWDAEHPRLYRMTASLLDSRGRVVETLERRHGFREIRLEGSHLLVNGQEVKFRGFWGGDDPAVLKSLNVNHTRQKWVKEDFLDACDSLGIYVLDEVSIDFAKFGPEHDPDFAYQWVGLIGEKIERDWDHPCVVSWGLGNESFHGENVLQMHRYARAEDPQRPTMFSWANRIRPDEELPYEIYSYHYAPADADLSDYGVSIWHSPSLVLERHPRPVMPVLVDEATHVCISTEELSRDPNVRNFWGESVLQSWDRVWNTDGALGMDQFGLFRYLADDTPEIWLLRKAYSPVHIARRDYPLPAAGEPLTVEVENRFCHTDLSELTVRWQLAGRTGALRGPAAAPRQKGTLRVPLAGAALGDTLELRFLDPSGRQVDEYRFALGVEPFRIPVPSGPAPRVEQDDRKAVIRGRDFVLVYDKDAGQIRSLTRGGETVLTGGPHLQLLRSGIDVAEYWPQSSRIYVEGDEAVINIEAIYSPIPVSFSIRIDGEGLMRVSYTLGRFPDMAPRPVILPWDGTDTGGYSEVGVKFILPASVDRLSWDRRGLWTVYPAGHIGRERGTARRTDPAPTSWKDWQTDHYWNDTHWSIYNADRNESATNDFRSSKEYIRTAEVLLGDSSHGVQVLSGEKDAVRLESARPDGEVTLIINNEWNYPTLGIGNWMKDPIRAREGYSGTVFLRPL